MSERPYWMELMWPRPRLVRGLRTRERLGAAIDGIDDWARADATPLTP